jgi:ABC-type Fe3+/spermidine/putrescine transport system ATPase subunit
MATLRTESLVFRQGDFVLGGVSLECPVGDCLALLGPSGSGKTTCLEIMAGLRAADSGRVWIDGRDVTGLPPERRAVSYLPQDVALFPHLSVRDNILFPARMRRIAPDVERLQRLCGTLGILPLLDRADVRSLSGGEAQRVAIARALLVPPRVLFLDECFGSLDAPRRRRLARQFRDLREATRTTTVMVTHDLDEACLMADRLAVLHRGTLEQTGTPDELKQRPATVQVAELMGMHNIWPVQACQRSDASWRCDMGGFELLVMRRTESAVPPQTLGFFAWDVQPKMGLAPKMRLAPEHGCLVPVPFSAIPSAANVNLLRGRVADCVRQGPVVVLRLAMENAPQLFLEAYWHDNRQPQPARGDWIEVQVHAQQIHSWSSTKEPGD